jgi:Tol biopolymer transport system component
MRNRVAITRLGRLDAQRPIHNQCGAMPLTAGTRIGSYEIVAPLGAGGMGEVYRARDSKLKREVAIKVLPADIAGDRDRLARFQREAEVLASLNHPHIAHVYGVEDPSTGSGQAALVMELVEGEDLAERIARGPIPIDDVLPIAKQIVAALEAAHEQGIIHRDLKPANVKVRPDGTVKVLDFGLAKTLEPPASRQLASNLVNSPTLTSPAMTHAGTILGTAAYMAPEQAKGHPVDKRADIWAFGVVVFEMVTGKPLFASGSVAETFAAILSKTPDWSQAPARLRPLLQATLEPDPRHRLRDIGDAFRLIDAAASPAEARSRRPSAALLAMGVVTLVAVALGVAGWTWRAASSPRAELRLQVALPPRAAPELGMALSPDGQRLAFVVVAADGTRSAWVRDLDDFAARPVPGADDLDTNPLSWSDDSRWLGFSSRAAFMKADIVAGGTPLRIKDGGQIGATWNADGTIVFGTNPGRGVGGAIYRLSAGRGDQVQLTTIDTARGEYAHHHPTFLPDGRRFLYLRAARPETNSGIYVGSIDAEPGQQSTERLIATSFGPVFFLPTGSDAIGFLFFLRDGALVAQRFDPSTVTLSGEAQQVAAGIGTFIDRALFSVSRNGTIAYADGVPVLHTQLTWVDRAGQVLRTIGAPGLFTAVARSPDGTKAAVTRLDAGSASEKYELWLWDLERNAQTLLWFKSPVRSRPIWSPDGTRVLFAIVDNGPQLFERSITGIQEGRVLFRGSRGDPLGLNGWSPDGRYVLFTRQTSKTGTDIWVLTPKDGAVAPLIQTAEAETDAEFSPDGRWIAYSSTESGRSEVYVTAVVSHSPALTVGGGPWRVSNGGGNAPRWRGDGREIFYAGPSSMMAAPVSTDSGFTAGAAAALPIGGVGTGNNRFGFIDATRDGKQFLVAKPITDVSPRAPMNVVLSWTWALTRD